MCVHDHEIRQSNKMNNDAFRTALIDSKLCSSDHRLVSADEYFDKYQSVLQNLPEQLAAVKRLTVCRQCFSCWVDGECRSLRHESNCQEVDNGDWVVWRVGMGSGEVGKVKWPTFFMLINTQTTMKLQSSTFEHSTLRSNANSDSFIIERKRNKLHKCKYQPFMCKCQLLNKIRSAHFFFIEATYIAVCMRLSISAAFVRRLQFQKRHYKSTIALEWFRYDLYSLWDSVLFRQVSLIIWKIQFLNIYQHIAWNSC